MAVKQLVDVRIGADENNLVSFNTDSLCHLIGLIHRNDAAIFKRHVQVRKIKVHAGLSLHHVCRCGPASKTEGAVASRPVSLLPFVFHHAVNHGHIHFYIVQLVGVNLENIPVQHDQICQLSIFNAPLIFSS